MNIENGINEDLRIFIDILKTRFNNHMERHMKIKWEAVEKKILENESKLISLLKMEDTGGEPDVIGFINNEYIFVDCSFESPKGRRSLCYDREALERRKANKPKNNAIDMAKELGVDILTEEQYKDLQKIGDFDVKSSSWVKTPDKIRKLGGALFCDKRYDTVFTYHNGAESYYGSRGFRAILKI